MNEPQLLNLIERLTESDSGRYTNLLGYGVCFFCGNDDEDEAPHEPDCPYIEARALLSEVQGAKISEFVD